MASASGRGAHEDFCPLARAWAGVKPSAGVWGRRYLTRGTRGLNEADELLAFESFEQLPLGLHIVCLGDVHRNAQRKPRPFGRVLGGLYNGLGKFAVFGTARSRS